MSLHILVVMPADPLLVPDPASLDAGFRLAGAIFARSMVKLELSTGLNIHHPVGNWEGVWCPVCGAALSHDWWGERASAIWERGATEISSPTSCCGAHVSLNDLRYRGAAGVARCALAIESPGALWAGAPASNAEFHQFIHYVVSAIERAWGCPARRVWERI